MTALLYLLIYLAAGLLIIRCLLPGKPLPVRVYLGLSLGFFLLMWLPALLAFFLPFDRLGHLLALLVLAVLCALSFALREKTKPLPFSDSDRQTLRLLAFTALPMTLLGAYLQLSHVLKPVDGALYTGQATYGDLPLHLAIITSLPQKVFPADYSIMPGLRLGYPFLADSLSSTFLVLGMDLRSAVVLPGSLMMGLVFTGVMLLALRVLKSRRSAVLAFLLVFFNGGLGFLYAFDMMGLPLGETGRMQLQQGQWLDRLSNILQGWYQTPANHAEFARYNLRWSNLVADMLLPQRTFLAGWLILIPCLYLLLDMLQSKFWPLRQTLLLGILAGGLPLIHTHSFLALGLSSAGFLAYSLLKKQPVKHFLLYGILAFLLALPQLIVFTFSQSSGEGFLRIQFNWVNNPGGQGLQDGYLWFYLKNIGLPFLLLIFALFEKKAEYRRILAGAVVIFVISEVIIFQPNEYDNNKLFYVWWLLCSLVVADYAFILYDRLNGLSARPLIAVVTALLMFLTGALAITREAIGSYPMFSAEDVAVARFIREETPRDSRFITGTQHTNPVSSLAGREIVVGPDLWLYYHGLDTRTRQIDLTAFYQDPRQNREIPQKYGADYILLGPSERNLGADQEALEDLYDLVYQKDGYLIFQVPQG